MSSSTNRWNSNVFFKEKRANGDIWTTGIGWPSEMKCDEIEIHSPRANVPSDYEIKSIKLSQVLP